jgi:universal stress protein E
MKILAATDLQPKSEAAIERAGLLAESLSAELIVLHAVSPDAAGGQTLEQRVRRADSRLSARTSSPRWHWQAVPEIRVQCGMPARVVLDTAYRTQADLLVLGPHRESRLADAMQGTITEKVLGAAACPVLIAQQVMHGAYRKVLVALDGMPGGGDVVTAFESLGLTRESHDIVVHAHEPPYLSMMDTVGAGVAAASSYAQSSRAVAASHIQKIIRAHSSDAGRYRIVIVDRQPAAAIVSAVEHMKPDLVVLGTRGHGRFRRALLGSVASEVMGAVRGDILLVPERAGRALRAAQQGLESAAAVSRLSLP